MIGVTKETASYGVPVFQKIIESVQGGFVLEETVLAAGTEVLPGTVIGFDESTRKAKVCKVAVVKNQSAANDTTYEVEKGHNLAVGMSVKVAGEAAVAITAIDKTTFTTHDVITTATTLEDDSVVPVGAAIYVDDDGYNKAGGLLLSLAKVQVGQDVAVVNRGTVYERRIVPVPATVKALIPHIIFSKSY